MTLEKFYNVRKWSVLLFVLLGIGSAGFIPRLQYNFSFEQFFPQGDKDLEYFRDFIEEFETDDNFLLVAIEHQPDIFDTSFLVRVRDFAIEARTLPYVRNVQALPLFRYPVMTPFGPSSVPALHLGDPVQMARDSTRLMKDERILFHLVNADASSTAVVLKTGDGLQLEGSKELMSEIRGMVGKYNFDEVRYLGRAYFQSELSALQFREILISTIISGILVSIIMILIYRKWASIMIALSSIGLGLVIFLGLLALLGRELSLMAALYPILMLIVGTSDVIHIMTKYFDELEKGLARKPALLKTIRQIGLATLLTSLTTAAGFATLLSSRIEPIRDFGINAAMGVVLAFIVVIGFTCPMLSFFPRRQLIPESKKNSNWPAFLFLIYRLTMERRKYVYGGALAFVAIAAWGISKIHTNYTIGGNMPRGEKITEDFRYFEDEYAGFRPLEIAGVVGSDFGIYDYEVIEAVSRLHDYVKEREEIETVFSLATLVRSINQMNSSNREDAYVIPGREDYRGVRRLIHRTKVSGLDMLVNEDKTKTRISARVKDVGSEHIRGMSADITSWIAANIDPRVIQFTQTGTGIILDKNSEFVRQSLLFGLGIALLIVSILMGLLFRSFKMLLLALAPNLIPLLFAAALLGFANEPLEAGIAIVFAIIFGIAVDDTIHFLSKYKLAREELGDREAALLMSYQEAGKAIIFTSIILFFGFLVLLFSVNPPSVTIGILIAVTLISAVVADLTILPALIRGFKL